MGWTTDYSQPSSAHEYFRDLLDRERYTILDSATVWLSEFYAATRNTATGEVSAFVAMIRWGRNSFSYKDMDEGMGPVIDRCPERILDLLTPLPDCHHDEDYCRFCNAEITGAGGGRWLSHAKSGQVAEVAGPRCYSGYPVSAKRDDGPPFHAPGGTAPCPTCWAREWRHRCRANVARRAQQRRLLTDGSTVRLVGAERYVLPADVVADPVFTVVRIARRVAFRHGVRQFRFSRTAEWERAADTGRAAS